jgi:hypothetical protein
MTTDDPHDFTYAEALAALRDSPRFAEFQVAFTALADQVLAMWQEVEPAIRTWVDQAAKLTEQQWMDEPERTRAFYESWREWFAEHEGEYEGERDSADDAEHDAE